MICKFDLKLFVPQQLLNFLVTKCMGVFLYYMQKKAIEVSYLVPPLLQGFDPTMHNLHKYMHFVLFMTRFIVVQAAHMLIE